MRSLPGCQGRGLDRGCRGRAPTLGEPTTPLGVIVGYNPPREDSKKTSFRKGVKGWVIVRGFYNRTWVWCISSRRCVKCLSTQLSLACASGVISLLLISSKRYNIACAVYNRSMSRLNCAFVLLSISCVIINVRLRSPRPRARPGVRGPGTRQGSWAVSSGRGE